MLLGASDGSMQDTIAMAEALLFHVPDIRAGLTKIGILYPPERSIAPVPHPELDSIMSPFKDAAKSGRLHCLSVIGNIWVNIMFTDPIGRSWWQWLQVGPDSSVGKRGFGWTRARVNETIRMREFLPSPVCVKMAYIGDMLAGGTAVFTQVGMNRWTLFDSVDASVVGVKMYPNEILDHILEDLRGGDANETSDGCKGQRER